VDKLKLIIKATRGGNAEYDPLENGELKHAIAERDQAIEGLN
jgi:hypothetical protein